MVHTMSATEAKVGFGKLLRKVAENGDTVIVEHSGKPKAVVLSVEEYNRLQKFRPADDHWLQAVHRAWECLDQDVGDRPLTPADEMIRQGREERDARILGLY